ncbi:MAG: TetR/AcrR family transcriptional regulator [Myxococcales bacterium]|nr:TetR/AcrR family transcriptional regulator [Myxococcales bacterium]
MNRLAASRSYVQKARAESAAANGERILASVTELFRETGREPTLEAVAERAGVTVQTVLRRFGSKQGLYDAVSEHVGGQIAAERGAAPVGDVEGAIDNLLDHYELWGDMALRMLGAESESAERRPASEGRSFHRGWVERVFAPFLLDLTGAAREIRVDQLAAVTDVYVWKILMKDLGRSRRRTKQTLVDLVRRLGGPR